jgi:hypothetical protein
LFLEDMAFNGDDLSGLIGFSRHGHLLTDNRQLLQASVYTHLCDSPHFAISSPQFLHIFEVFFVTMK